VDWPSVLEEGDIGSTEDAEPFHGLAQIGGFGECLGSVQILGPEEKDNLARVMSAPEEMHFREAGLAALGLVSVVSGFPQREVANSVSNQKVVGHGVPPSSVVR
jgi:hypothetical protein